MSIRAACSNLATMRSSCPAFRKYFNMTGWRLGLARGAGAARTRSRKARAKPLHLAGITIAARGARLFRTRNTRDPRRAPACIRSPPRLSRARVARAGLRDTGPADRRLLHLCRLLGVHRRQHALLPRGARGLRRRIYAGRGFRTPPGGAARALRVHDCAAKLEDASRGWRDACGEDAAPAGAGGGAGAGRLRRHGSRRLLLAGRERAARHRVAREADHRGHLRIAGCRAQAASPPRTGDSRLREPRARASRQRQLHQVCGPWPAVRRVERLRRAGAVAQATAMVLSGRRLRELSAATSRKPRRARKQRACRPPATTCGSAGCLRIPRSAISTTRCCRRHPLARCRSGAHGLPRTRAPGGLHQGRHAVQRILRRRGGRDGLWSGGSHARPTRSSMRNTRAPAGCAPCSAT